MAQGIDSIQADKHSFLLYVLAFCAEFFALQEGISGLCVFLLLLLFK